MFILFYLDSNETIKRESEAAYIFGNADLCGGGLLVSEHHSLLAHASLQIPGIQIHQHLENMHPRSISFQNRAGRCVSSPTLCAYLTSTYLLGQPSSTSCFVWFYWDSYILWTVQVGGGLLNLVVVQGYGVKGHATTLHLTLVIVQGYGVKGHATKLQLALVVAWG